MYRLLSRLILFLFLPVTARSQVLPKEGSKLNYRLIGFLFPSPLQKGGCKLEIAPGHYNSPDSFTHNIVTAVYPTKNKIIAEVPAFGSQYTWRVVFSAGKKTVAGPLHHFSTSSTSAADTNIIRLRIIKPALKYGDAYVFSDGNKALYDMNGKPVWFLPETDGFNNDSSEVRDLKLSPLGTITFLLNNRAYEVNYNGRVLWTGPDNGNITKENKYETYHHEFTRMANGQYMLLGNKLEQWKLKVPFPAGDSASIADDNESTPKSDLHLGDLPGYRKRQFGTLVEYDSKGDITWEWKSVDYFKDFDYYSISPFSGLDVITPHENAFYFDEQNKVIYVGFRNISRIVKLKYPSGKILNTYGEIYQKDKPMKENLLFCGQHSCRRSEQGYLYLFNNSCNLWSVPKITVVQEPVSEKDSLKKIWEYEIPNENINRNEQKGKYAFTAGGNVMELPGNSFFVSTTTTSGRIFIVNHDKEILWNAIPEKWNAIQKKWYSVQEYRASIISGRQDLEQLIWNAESEK